MRLRPGRVSIIVVIGLGLSLLPAAEALAASAAIAGPELLVGDEPGQASKINIVQSGNTYTIIDPAGVTAGNGCTAAGNTLTCTGNVAQVVVTVDDLADTIKLNTATGAFVDAGSGNDVVRQAGNGPLNTTGGSGNDRLTGGSRADLIRGGSGDDHLKGAEGEDQLLAKGGDDTIKARDGEEDSVRGGSGRDEAFVDNQDSVEDVERIRP